MSGLDRIADYHIERTMRRGNHGVLHLAVPPRRLGLDVRWVALKVLDMHGTDDDFRRIANELRLLNSTRSPFVVRLLDAGNHQGRLFFAMPYYAEGSLEDAHGRLATTMVVQAIADAARGAHRLHELGVAHRDIKPANVLVNRGRGVLADLGLAQLLGERSTTLGRGPIGSLHYMAPSIIRGEQASRHTDLYSLGATLHHAAMGRPLLEGLEAESLLGALRIALHTPPTIAADCPPVLGQIIAGAVGLDTAYATAEAFADDLDAMLEAHA